MPFVIQYVVNYISFTFRQTFIHKKVFINQFMHLQINNPGSGNVWNSIYHSQNIFVKQCWFLTKSQNTYRSLGSSRNCIIYSFDSSIYILLPTIYQSFCALTLCQHLLFNLDKYLVRQFFCALTRVITYVFSFQIML